MTIKIPNEVGTTLAGTPSPANIATESRDGTQSVGQSDNIQQISLVNIMAELKYYLSTISKVFSLASTGYNGCMRAQVENFGPWNGTYATISNGPTQWSHAPVGQITAFTSIAHSSPINSMTNGAGGALYKSDTMLFDIHRKTWYNVTNKWISRS